MATERSGVTTRLAHNCSHPSLIVSTTTLLGNALVPDAVVDLSVLAALWDVRGWSYVDSASTSRL
eukprot:6326911-Amphidinium_carterae.1